MMIVMESLLDDALTLLRYQPRAEPSDSDDEETRYLKRLPRPAPASWDELADLRTAVELLHRHDFVHGDIRHQNAMLQRPWASGGSDDVSRAYLIDFDRAGKWT